MRIWKILAMELLLVLLAVCVQGADKIQTLKIQPEKRSVRSVFQKLDAIKLGEFEIAKPAPLSNVIERLNLEIRKHDPETSGLTIRLVPSPSEAGASKSAEASAFMIPNPGPPLRDVSIIQIVGMTTRYAPIAYAIREDGLEIFPFKRDQQVDIHEKAAREPRILYLDISAGYGYGNSVSKHLKIREGARFVVRGNPYPQRGELTLMGQVGYSKDNLVPFIVVTEGGGHTTGFGRPIFVPVNMPWGYSIGGSYNGPSGGISIWTEPPATEPEEATDSREGINWQRRVGAVYPGTKRYAVEALLPRYSAPLQNAEMSLPKITTLSGGKTVETYWVAEDWRVSVGYNHAGSGAPEDQVTSIKLEQVDVGGKQ